MGLYSQGVKKPVLEILKIQTKTPEQDISRNPLLNEACGAIASAL
jgi:hypothetical protein